ncbi:hypothetical protein [Microvirga sp. TS319]|uniref:hypothetical protein n=1 Tax=Microvirga sp. TS319 TaxID=3241165 RepID=UPI00351A2B2F
MTISVINAGPEVRINTTTPGTQTDPDVTVLANGGWVVTWESNVDIYQQRYDPQGAPAGGESRVNVITVDTQRVAVVTALPDGGWVVTWESRAQDGSGWGIYQQRFDAEGQPQFLDDANHPQDRLINTTVTGDQRAASVTALPLDPDGSGGGWVVTWQGPRADGTNGEIYQQRYAQDGTPTGPETQVNTLAVNFDEAPSVTTLADGGWVVTWENGDVRQQRFDKNGNPDGDEAVVYSAVGTNRFAAIPSVAALIDGGWVVTWDVSNGKDGWGRGIYQQRYDADGDPVGAMTKVNATIAGDQRNSSVAALADGGWVVSWESETQDGSGYGIYQQRFGADGAPLGGETLVTIGTIADQAQPHVTSLPDGSWLVAYQSYHPTENSTPPDVYVRRFMPADGQALTPGDDMATGTDSSETLSIAQGTFNAADRLDGGRGIDTLAMIAAGVLDLTIPSALAGFEVVRGSAGNDTLVANAGRLAEFAVIDGGAGTNVLRLSGNAFDLSNKTFMNVGIELTDAAGTAVTLNEKSIASLLDGAAGGADRVILMGGAFTVRERGLLFRHGIETVTDSSGTYTNSGPTDIALSGGTVLELSGTGTAVGTLQVEDPNAWDEITYSLLDDAGGRFALRGDGTIVVKNGLLLDFEQQGSFRIKVRATDAGGLSHDKELTVTIGNRSTEVTGGSSAANTFVGGSGKDRLGGGGGNDVLVGGGGNDTLSGGAGKDTLTGGSGADVFLFESAPNKLYPDAITDFSSRYDTFQLKKAIFKALPMGPLSSTAFVLGKTAKDANDRIIYDKSTGSVYYDADGTGKIAAIKIATLANKASVFHHDFIVI